MHSHLHLALAIIHHAVLRSHGLVGVQGGGVEGHLIHFGDTANGVGLTGAGRLIFVLPVAEELLEQSCLGSSREDLDLCREASRRWFFFNLVSNLISYQFYGEGKYTVTMGKIATDVT